jgi:hypothetical protein
MISNFFIVGLIRPIYIDPMQRLIATVLIAVLCMIIYLIIINILTLRTVMKLRKSEDKRKISDERYHELNNKIQLLIVVSSILILIFGFFGTNSIKTIESEVRGSLAKLQDEYKLNAKTYFVSRIKIDQTALTDNNKSTRMSFEKLGELNDKIPSKFGQEPYIWAMPRGAGFITITKITNEYFEYKFSGTIQLNVALSDIKTGHKTNSINAEDATSFDLIIIEGENQ